MSAATAHAPAPSARRALLLSRAPILAAEYDFESRWLDVPTGRLHHLDEGPAGAAPLLMLHGNPTWSFFFRRLVRAFRGERRVVAPDHLGCGLSDHPADFAYTLEAHVKNVERLVLALDLREITLVLHDWGGAIGMGFARRHPDRVARLVLLNTAAFRSARCPLRIRVCRAPLLGALAVRGLNAFARAATFMTVERPLAPEVARAYVAPYGSWSERVAVDRFVRDIPLAPGHPSWDELAATDEALVRFRDRPAQILWGEQDWCFTPHFREVWQERLPDAEVHRIEDAGHYVLEDAHERVIPWMHDFLTRTDRR